jgi:hypothetical protein
MKRTKQATLLNKYGGAITLPGRFRVRIQILDKNEERTEIPGKVLAQYFQTEHLITLRSSRNLKQRKSDLEHELQHACVDWVDHMMRKAYVVKPKKKQS